MLDLTTDRGRIVSAALAIASDKTWETVTLADISDRAGTTLVALKSQFASKAEILRAFTVLVDDEVLTRAPKRENGQSARDALFEVVMSRFDALGAWKPALRSIIRSGPPEPSQVAAMLGSMRWMLEAAGIGASGVDGAVRTAGLAAVYASVFRVWLDDDDPGLARTMAALDRRLRRGERSAQRADDLVNGMRRAAGALFGAADTVRSRMGGGRRGGGAHDDQGSAVPPSV